MTQETILNSFSKPDRLANAEGIYSKSRLFKCLKIEKTWAVSRAEPASYAASYLLQSTHANLTA